MIPFHYKEGLKPHFSTTLLSPSPLLLRFLAERSDANLLAMGWGKKMKKKKKKEKQ